MIGFAGPRGLLALEDRLGQAVAVAVLLQLAPELVDEQPPVREDQHAFRARRLDEARRPRSSCRTRWGGGSGSGGSRRGPRRPRRPPARRRPRAPPGSSGRSSSVSSSSSGDLLGVAVPPFSSSFWFAEISSVSMPGERVDLMAAQLGARGEGRGLVRQHALEAEHQRVANAPGRRGRLEALAPSPRARRRAPGGGRCRAREPPRDPRRDGGTAHPPRLRRGGRRRSAPRPPPIDTEIA